MSVGAHRSLVRWKNWEGWGRGGWFREGFTEGEKVKSHCCFSLVSWAPSLLVRLSIFSYVINYLVLFFAHLTFGILVSFFWLHRVAYRILVPQPGIEPGPWQWKRQVLTGQPGNSQMLLFLNFLFFDCSVLMYRNTTDFCILIFILQPCWTYLVLIVFW